MMPAVAAVEKIYTEKTGVPFDSDSIQEAVALFVLAQAIEKAGTLDYAKVQETLMTNEWEAPLTLAGKVAFVSGGQNVQAKSMITQLQGGSYKRVFPENLADTPVVFPMTPWDKR
jgi:branched-chain amino acid transport system substrate-binding protein